MALFKQANAKPLKRTVNQTAKKPQAKPVNQKSKKVSFGTQKSLSSPMRKVNAKPTSATHNTQRPRNTVATQKQRGTVAAKNPRAASAVKKPISKKPAQKRVNNPKAINSKIKAQSPKRRLANRNNKKVNGGVKNFEINRRPKQVNHKFYIKKKKVRNKGMFKRMLILFLVAFLLFCGVFAFFFSLSLRSENSGKSYTLLIGKMPEDENSIQEAPTYEIPKQIAEKNGVKYLPMYLISDYCDLTVSGTPNQLKYSSRNVSGQNIRFNVDSNIAFVNGIKVILKNAPALYEGRLYVPVEVFTDYATGLTFEFYEENNTLVMFKDVIDYDKIEKSDITSELSFKLSSPVACPAIAQPQRQENEKNYDKYFNNDYDDEDDDYDYDYDYDYENDYYD